MSTKIEVEMVVASPHSSKSRRVHPPVLRPCQPQLVQECGAVGDGGDGGDGRGRAWVLEFILQLIARAGKGPPRRAWLPVGGPLEGFLSPISLGQFWAFTFKRDKSRGFKAER